MLSKTKILQRAKKKNPELAEAIFLAKNNKELASLLAVPKRKQIILNLGEIDKEIKENEKIIVPGKVLGKGAITKKIKITALEFSDEAEKKLKEAKCEILNLKEELRNNKKIDGRIIR